MVIPQFPNFDAMDCTMLKGTISGLTETLNAPSLVANDPRWEAAYRDAISRATAIYNSKCGAGGGGGTMGGSGGTGSGSGGTGSGGTGTDVTVVNVPPIVGAAVAGGGGFGGGGGGGFSSGSGAAPAKKKSSIWPWIIGALVLGVIMFGSKSKKSQTTSITP
jgi:hypothetical protein